ncbi:MAG: hypothetical protein HYT15_03570 [Candidatus Magasanikbacteria bacterium]|nr:hypothetical protein [Candidatus Magasanikbacteria bacterium]
MRFNGDCNTDRGSMEQEFPVPRPYYPTPSQQMKAVKPEFAVALSNQVPANLVATSSKLPTAEVVSTGPEGTSPLPKFAVDVDAVEPGEDFGKMEWATLICVSIFICACIGVVIWAAATGQICR